MSGGARESEEALAEAAARWALLHDDGGLTAFQRRAFERWAARSPGHAAAFAEAADALARVRAAAGAPAVVALRADALAVRGDGVVWRRLAAGVLLAAGIGLGAAVLWPGLWPGLGQGLREQVAALAPPAVRAYHTEVGERATVNLPDGSVATLDTGSEIQVAYSARERGVRLLRGQALFDVAKHRPQPFRVYAAGRRITAVGTRFDVRIDEGGRLRLTLVEGRVRVDRTGEPFAPALSPAILVSAGEMLEAQADTTTVRPADPGPETSWENGLLTFQDEPLAQAVAEMNRYSATPVRLQGPVGGYRVSGVFRTGDPARFARTLAEALPLAVSTGADGAPVLAPKP